MGLGAHGGTTDKVVYDVGALARWAVALADRAQVGT